MATTNVEKYASGTGERNIEIFTVIDTQQSKEGLTPVGPKVEIESI